MLRRRDRKVGFSASQLPEGEQDRIVQATAILASAELRLAGRARNRHRVGTVGHQIALRNSELDPKVGVSEGRPLDHALRRIVVNIDSFEFAQELVAIADPGPEPACRLSGSQRPLHSVFT